VKRQHNDKRRSEMETQREHNQSLFSNTGEPQSGDVKITVLTALILLVILAVVAVL
jgi:hypothetical protein